MKSIIQVNYKAIFKYIEHKESISYQEVGYLEKCDEKKKIMFDNQQEHIEIHIHNQEVILKNNHTKLRLVQDKKIKNRYQSEYGEMEIFTKLILFEDGNTIKIKYQLFDQVALLSEVYVLITVKVLEN